MSGTTSQAEPNSRTNPLREALGWVAKHSPRIDLGHEGMMLESMQRGLRIREAIARNTMTGDMQNLDGWPGHEGEDAMGVNIGDHIHYHQTVPTPAAPQPSPPVEQAATTTEEPSLLSKALPWVVAAGLGVGGYMLGNKPATTEQSQTKPQVEAPQTQPQSGMDQYGIKLEHYVPGAPQ